MKPVQLQLTIQTINRSTHKLSYWFSYFIAQITYLKSESALTTFLFNFNSQCKVKGMQYIHYLNLAG
jgi:hypothetical protein